MHPLTRQRRGKGWSMDVLATKSGVSKRAIVNIENENQGDAFPHTLLKLARALGCEPADLME